MYLNTINNIPTCQCLFWCRSC